MSVVDDSDERNRTNGGSSGVVNGGFLGKDFQTVIQPPPTRKKFL